jgi:DNA-binding response OmpR family regulator
MVMRRILVVEDSHDDRELIRCILADEYELSLAASLAEARDWLRNQLPDLILLDLRLPDGMGFELCAELRARAATRDIPLVFLTAIGEIPKKVQAFALGADDYVEKPFAPEELLARVARRLRKPEAPDRAIAAIGPLCVDPSHFRATLTTDAGTRVLDLTPHELLLLFELASRRGEVATRRELLEAVWAGISVSNRTLNTHLSNLRRKLGGESPRIEAVRGIGYRLRWPR